MVNHSPSPLNSATGILTRKDAKTATTKRQRAYKTHSRLSVVGVSSGDWLGYPQTQRLGNLLQYAQELGHALRRDMERKTIIK